MSFRFKLTEYPGESNSHSGGDWFEFGPSGILTVHHGNGRDREYYSPGAWSELLTDQAPGPLAVNPSMADKPTTNQPDEVNAAVLDAIALFTASYDEELSTMQPSLLAKILGGGSDVELAGRLLGLVAGMTVVARHLLEYSVHITGDAEDAALDDLAGDANNATVIRHLREITALAKQFAVYYQEQSGFTNEDVLSDLARNLNIASNE